MCVLPSYEHPSTSKRSSSRDLKRDSKHTYEVCTHSKFQILLRKVHRYLVKEQILVFSWVGIVLIYKFAIRLFLMPFISLTASALELLDMTSVFLNK